MTGKINFGINFVSWTLCKSYSVHDRYLFAWLNLHEIMIRKSKKIGHRCFSPRFSHLETWIFHFRLGQKPRGAGTCNRCAESSSNRNLEVYFINVYNFTPKFELRLNCQIPGIFHYFFFVYLLSSKNKSRSQFFSLGTQTYFRLSLPEIRTLGGFNFRWVLGVQWHVQRRTSHKSGYH